MKQLRYYEQCLALKYLYDPVEKKELHFKNGLAQGSMLSPLLFNMARLQ